MSEAELYNVVIMIMNHVRPDGELSAFRPKEVNYIHELLSRIKVERSDADAEKVGQWIDIQYFKSDDTYYRPKCPFCNTEPKEYSNYCPKCGAKMQEVEE